ncbi:MAG TPA: hypothetical protein VIL74_13955 [Pyrinomonadaceae bacterium]|jgi:hypothetical protein
MKTISKAEKTDILLALAMTFESKSAAAAGSAAPPPPLELAEAIRGALSDEDGEALRARAAALDALPAADRETWRERRFEKIRGRGMASRLDENINPSHVVEILSREPRAIQFLILRNLPADLSRRISLYLDLNFLPESPNVKSSASIGEDLVALVRRKFLANFIALEDLYEPDEVDRLSINELENFIRQLGLREIAIACRGINSKETLAAFLNRFDEEDAREIALYLTELDKIRPFWVAQADALVRKSWSADLPPAKVVKKIGLQLLASGFIERDEAKSDYAAQKMPFREVKNWQRLVRVGKKKYSAADEDERLRLDKRRRTVERLAVKFAETGKL